MGESFWQRQQTPQWGFLENYPFTALIDAGLGWRVTSVDSPRMRPHKAEPIRVVHMQDNFERFLTFDVTADSNRIRRIAVRASVASAMHSAGVVSAPRVSTAMSSRSARARYSRSMSTAFRWTPRMSS